MISFFRDLLVYPFLLNAVLAAALIAIAAGFIGSFVVVRRSTYLAGAVSHTVLAGIGIARLLNRRFSIHWLSPMLGALIVGVGVALLLAWLTRKEHHRTDTILSAVWTGGMAIGVSCLAATPGYQDDLMSYLFGSILLVTKGDLLGMALMDILIVSTVLICYNRFLAIAFNRALAQLRGVNTLAYEMVFYVLTALTVILLVRLTGIVLAIALLTLPAATAGKLTRRLDHMIALTIGIGFGISLLGLAASYLPGWPPGATIVELALVAYALVSVGIHLKRKA